MEIDNAQKKTVLGKRSFDEKSEIISSNKTQNTEIRFSKTDFLSTIDRLINLKNQKLSITIDQIEKLFCDQYISFATTDYVNETDIEFFIRILNILKTQNIEYGNLSGRIYVQYQIHNRTNDSFSKTMRTLNNHIAKQLKPHGEVDEKYDEFRVEKKGSKIISDKIIEYLDSWEKEGMLIDNVIEHERDFFYDYFAACTWVGKSNHGYLLRLDGKLMERIQYALMRVAVQFSEGNWDWMMKSYNAFSRRLYTHASPTLFTAGSDKFRPSSCFLLQMKHDSINGIYETLKEVALISAGGGGIGFDATPIRPEGSHISGSNGTSEGVPSMLINFNATAKYANQGGMKRKGAISAWLDSSHPDFYETVAIKSIASGTKRLEDIFVAGWMRDHFMKRLMFSVKSNNPEMTYKFLNPQQCEGLVSSWGFEYEMLYRFYTEELKYWHSERPIRKVWAQVLLASYSSGVPYLCGGDQANRLSNQNNVNLDTDPEGTQKPSNVPILCTEIFQYSGPEDIGNCNLASINLH